MIKAYEGFFDSFRSKGKPQGNTTRSYYRNQPSIDSLENFLKTNSSSDIEYILTEITDEVSGIESIKYAISFDGFKNIPLTTKNDKLSPISNSNILDISRRFVLYPTFKIFMVFGITSPQFKRIYNIKRETINDCVDRIKDMYDFKKSHISISEQAQKFIFVIQLKF